MLLQDRVLHASHTDLVDSGHLQYSTVHAADPLSCQMQRPLHHGIHCLGEHLLLQVLTLACLMPASS